MISEPITPEESPLQSRQKILIKQSGRVNLLKVPNYTQEAMTQSFITNYEETNDFTSFFNENEITVLHHVSLQHGPNVNYASTCTSPSSQGSAEQLEDFSCDEDSSINSGHESLNLNVCCQRYESRLQGDLNLYVNEKVVLLIKTDNYSLVKKLKTGECGYVANTCLKPV